MFSSSQKIKFLQLCQFLIVSWLCGTSQLMKQVMSEVWQCRDGGKGIWDRGIRDRDGGRGIRDRDGGKGIRDRDGFRGIRDRDGGRGIRDRDGGRGTRDTIQRSWSK